MNTFRARWVVPVAAPPIEDGAIAVQDGRIVAVGRSGDVPAGEILDFGDAVVLPGMVNAHTHLELTGLRGLIPPMPLTDWFTRMLELFARGQVSLRGADATREGARQSLAAGVTCVGDISRTGTHMEALVGSAIRRLCFLECISGGGLGPSDVESLSAAIEAARPFVDASTSRVGVSPHAPYTVLAEHLRGIVALADTTNVPITMHWLETPEEREWIAKGTGVISDFLRSKGLPTQHPSTLHDPVELLQQSGIGRLRPLLAHCNYASARDIDWLARHRCSVAYCPRAHDYFGHAPHTWREMLAAGVNVCVGTDSLACNASLSVLDELRFLRRRHPEFGADRLLEMGTVRGARALQWHEELGGLEPGRHADFVVVRCGDSVSSPIEWLLDGDSAVGETWIAGRRVWAA